MNTILFHTSILSIIFSPPKMSLTPHVLHTFWQAICIALLSPKQKVTFLQNIPFSAHRTDHSEYAYWNKHIFIQPHNPSVQFSSVAQSCPTLCHPNNRSMPGLPVHHQLPEFTQTHIHRVSDAIQPSYPLSSPSPPAPNPSQHQCLFQWVNSLHEVAKVLEFQI